ncbi:hypothetical protein [Streptomyces olivaceiscleroticus]
MAPDIAAALSDPQTGDRLPFHGFEVVTDLAELRGAGAGPVDVAGPSRSGHSCRSRPRLSSRAWSAAEPSTRSLRYSCRQYTGPAGVGVALPRAPQRSLGTAVEREHKISVARAVLSACADQGYGVAGSLATRLHQVDGAREPDDNDLFTDHVVNGKAVRGRITAALREAGYTVDQLVAWNTYPDGAGEQNRKLSVSQRPPHRRSGRSQGVGSVDMGRAGPVVQRRRAALHTGESPFRMAGRAILRYPALRGPSHGGRVTGSACPPGCAR